MNEMIGRFLHWLIIVTMTAFVYTITGFIRRHNLGKTSEKVIGLEKGLQNSGITVKMEKVYEKYDFFKKRIWREKKMPTLWEQNLSFCSFYEFKNKLINLF